MPSGVETVFDVGISGDGVFGKEVDLSLIGLVGTSRESFSIFKFFIVLTNSFEFGSEFIRGLVDIGIFEPPLMAPMIFESPFMTPGLFELPLMPVGIFTAVSFKLILIGFGEGVKRVVEEVGIFLRLGLEAREPILEPCRLARREPAREFDVENFASSRYLHVSEVVGGRDSNKLSKSVGQAV